MTRFANPTNESLVALNAQLDAVLHERGDRIQRDLQLVVQLLADELESDDRRTWPVLAMHIDREEHCCYAKKSTVWARDPQGLHWEFYKVNADSEDFGVSTTATVEAAARANEEEATVGGCCGR